jgi:DNA-binding NarL/FixJ family response regulator
MRAPWSLLGGAAIVSVRMPSVARSVDVRRGRVLAVDDQPGFLAILRELLGATRQLDAVGEAQSGERAIELAQEVEPDIVLMDVWMPGMGGLAAAHEIKARRPSTLVLLISSTHPDELPFGDDDGSVDAVIWKSDLDPQMLDDIWRRAASDAAS